MNDGAEMKLLGGDKWKRLPQIKTLLSPKHRIRSRASAVSLEFSFFKNEAKEVVVWLHRNAAFCLVDEQCAITAILILSVRGGLFTGSGEFIRSGKFIRRAKRVPCEARKE